jgi:TPR repeat protein
MKGRINLEEKMQKAELYRRCGKDEKAINLLEKLIKEHDVAIVSQAHYNLGLISENPERGKRNIQKAIHHYQTAFDLGCAEASEDLGNFYYFGTGIKKNVIKACEIWEKGFKLGSECAGFQLISHIFHFTTDYKHTELLSLIDSLLNRNASWKSLYYNKFKIYSDKTWDGYNIDEAIKYLKIYAEKVGDFGYSELAELYTSGEHIKPNEIEAEKYFKKINKPFY